MFKFIKFVPVAAAVVLAVIFSGCATADKISQSDLDVETLELRMARAMDPDGRYAASSGSVIRQEVRIPQFLDDDIECMVETRMARPDKVLISTYDGNELEQVVGFDGRSGWLANYRRRRVDILEGAALTQILNMAKLANQTGSYRKIFEKVEVFRCSNNDGEFYLLQCRGNGGSEFKIYVDASTFFVRRLSGKIKMGGRSVDYESRITSYARHQGVLVPQESEIEQNGEKQIVKIIDYKLNVKFQDGDFLPPVF